MLFPESERVVFQKNPLVEVICQLRFPTILEISSEDPVAFQKKIRPIYPVYEKEEEGISIPKEISQFIAQFPMAKSSESLIHKFITEDSSRSVSLNSNYVAITNKECYESWDQFKREIKVAKEATEECYQPAFYSRIGLRYVDIIEKSKLGIEKEPWHTLIRHSLLGLLAAEETRDNVEGIGGQVLIRIDEVQEGFVQLRHALVKREEGRRAYRIDADFFTRERRAIGDVTTILDQFNRLAGNLFRWAITERLQSTLGIKD